MSSRPLFSVCHTTARPGGWRRAYDLWRSRARYPETVEYVLCADDRWNFTWNSLDSTLQDLGTVRTWNTGRKCMVDGYAAACRAATGQVLILGSDDIEPPEHWDALLSTEFYESGLALDPCARDFVVHVSTGWWDGPQSSSIQILSRGRYERLGYAMFPEYESLYADDDFLEHAYADGVVIDARKLMFPHSHPSAPAEFDEVYRHQENGREVGRELLERRRAAGFGVPAPLPKVILFCPVRQSAAVFEHVLLSHHQLAGITERWYTDDNSDSNTSALLRYDSEKLLPLPGHFPADSRPEYVNHVWAPGAVSRVAEIKDAAILEFLKTDADFLLLIDADVVPHPALVRHLVSLNLECVSEVFWSRWRPDQPWMPQVWDQHNYKFHSAENVLRLRLPGVFPVGGLGACTLLRRDALEKGLSFAPVPGLDFWGEDRHFCARASALGVALHADTHFPPFHVYRDLQIDEMVAWRGLGCRPEHFRDMWLNEDWKTAVRRWLTGGPRESRAVACCLPGEAFHSSVACQFSALDAHLTRRGFTVLPIYGECTNPHGVREVLRSEALATGADLVLWIDDDQLLSGAQFDQLLQSLDSLPGASFVAGWSWCDTGESPVISAGTVQGDGVRFLSLESVIRAAGLIEVEFTGFPAVLMRAETLRCDPLPFAPILAPASRWGHLGEDVAFCVTARARLGAAAFVDPKVFLPHLKVKALGVNGAPVSIERARVEADAVLHGSLNIVEVDKGSAAMTT